LADFAILASRVGSRPFSRPTHPNRVIRRRMELPAFFLEYFYSSDEEQLAVDLHGNVIEWCHDWSGSYGSTSDPVGAATGSLRLGRGRGWRDGAAYCRSGLRSKFGPQGRSGFVGFRLALNSAGEWWQPEFLGGTDRFPLRIGNYLLGEI